MKAAAKPAIKKLIPILMLSLATPAIADPKLKSERLKVERIKNYVFLISESNEAIHVQSPMQLQASLIENTGLGQKERYTLSIQGQMKFDPEHEAVKQIQARYPTFNLTGSVASAQVAECQIKLPDGTSVSCELPPISGNYVSALQILSRAQGESLLEAIRKGGGLDVKVQVEENTPESVRFEQIPLRLNQVCQNLAIQSEREKGIDRRGSTTSVTLESLLVASTREAAIQLGSSLSTSTLHPGLVKRAIQRAMTGCLQDGKQTIVSDLERVRTFSELMSKKVPLKTKDLSGNDPVWVGYEELQYKKIARPAALEVQYQVL